MEHGHFPWKIPVEVMIFEFKPTPTNITYISKEIARHGITPKNCEREGSQRGARHQMVLGTKLEHRMKPGNEDSEVLEREGGVVVAPLVRG